MLRTVLIFALIIVVGLLAGILLTRAQLLNSPDQPIPYSHKTHVEVGIQCLYCHSEASHSPLAGMPSVAKCMGCHEYFSQEDEGVQTLVGYWERKEPIPWKPVNRQPDFVYFSHQAHLNSGINCESCHGFVGNMDEARTVARMDMGWCLECHQEQPQEKVAHLMDCLVCHK